MLPLAIRHRGEAREKRIATFEEIALLETSSPPPESSPPPTWDEQYQRFELLLRHDFHGEPRSAGELRFFPKLRPLRDALLAYEAYKHETASAWSFFSSLLPRIFRAACSYDEAPPDAHTFSPSQVASFLSNAFLLNAPGPLDFLSSGKDPLFVSGAKIAPQKVLCLLAYLDEALHGSLAEASNERTISFERVSGPDWEQVAAPAVQQPLHETLELAAEGEPSPDEAEAEAEVTVCDSVVLFCSANFGGGAVEGLSATQEEIGLLRYPEALLGLLCFPMPLLPHEALLVRGVRRYCDTCGYTTSNPTSAGLQPHGPMHHRLPLSVSRRGYAHTFAFAGRPSSSRAAPLTLLGLDAARCPGPAQFAPALVARELTKAHAGFVALARSGAGCCETGLWGCEGAHISPRTLRCCAARCPPAAQWPHATPLAYTRHRCVPALCAQAACVVGTLALTRRLQRWSAGAAHAAAAARCVARWCADAARATERHGAQVVRRGTSRAARAPAHRGGAAGIALR